MITLKEKTSPSRLSSTTYTDLLSYNLKIEKQSFVIEIVICYESSNDKSRTISWINLRVMANNIDYRQMWYNTNTNDGEKSLVRAIELCLIFGIRDLYPKMMKKIVHDIFYQIARHCDRYILLFDTQFSTLIDKEYIAEYKKEYEALKAKYRKENLAKAEKEKRSKK
jgi:hypothetical protein